MPGQDAGELPRVLALHIRELERVRGLRPRSIEERRNAIRRTDGWLRARRGTDLLHATRVDLEEWQLELTGEIGHRNNQTGHIKAFCEWACDKEYLAVNPAAALKRGKNRARRRAPRLPDDQVVNRALALTDDPRILTGLLLAIGSGLRACEIAGLRSEDVHHRGDAPWLMVWNGKGGKDRRVPIPRPIARMLATLLAGDWAFERRDGELGPVDPNTVTTVVNTYLHEIVGTERTLHGMRHWYATRTYEIDLNLIGLQQRLGHEDVSTTAIYVTLVEDRQARPTIEQLSDLLPGLATVHDLDERRRRKAEGGPRGGGPGRRDPRHRADGLRARIVTPVPAFNHEPGTRSCRDTRHGQGPGCP